jgi:tryptophanyl-tRNA synthetase
MDKAERTKAESGAVARMEDLEPAYTDKDGKVHKKRILTGDRTTGKLHLGHYVGSLRSRVELQGKYDTFILMADVQALTTHWDRPEVLKESVRDVALDYLAVGLDPYTGGKDDQSKAKIAVQSAIPSIAELTVLYGLVTPMSLIMDNPTTKAEAQQYGMGEENDRTEALTWSPDLLDSAISRILEEFSEIGRVLPEEMDYAIETIRRKGDVSLDKATEEYMQFNDWPLACMSQLTVYRRAIRDELISHKRSSGIRQMSYGFIGYPVSQAADITFVNAHLVPVGEDQVPHIELTREIVRRMNKQYGGGRRILTEPQALIGGGTLKALDGSAKMSKSLGNAVYLTDSDAEIWSKVKKAVTDPQRIRRDDPGRPEICNVFAYHREFNNDVELAIAEADVHVDGVKTPCLGEIAAACRTAEIGCVECKKHLAAKLKVFLDPMRERRANWEGRMDDVMDILREGTRRGNEEGNATVARVKEAMHVDYWK